MTDVRDLTPVDPRVVSAWRVSGLVRLVGWSPGLLVTAIAAHMQFGTAVAAGIVTALVLGIVVHALLWPPLRYANLGYALRDAHLEVARGVLVRRATNIPYVRIQHVDTTQGPVERFFGVHTVIVYTAAGMDADGVVPGLDEERARALRDALLARARAVGAAADGV
jgi:membrane protein YdbS with pleckstrin-like domain